MTDSLVGDLDETALIAAFAPLLPRGRHTLVGPGDDSAVVAAPDGRVVISTDVLVEDHHFRRAWSTPFDVGRRAAMQNLADIAAMGALPTALVVSLVLPRDLPVAWVTEFARGLASACTPLGAGVVGGDLSAGERIVVAVTVHGDLAGRPPVLRSGARPGDVVAVAGRLGRSAAGYALLSADDGAAHLGKAAPDHPAPGALGPLVAAFLRPDPPIEAGASAAAAGATALIDVSDGLLIDAGRVARASAVVVDMASAALEEDVGALAAAARHLGAAPGQQLEWVLTGGEDHALFATFPPGAVPPEPFRVIGGVLGPGAAGAAGTVLLDGARPPVARLGWDHFSAG